MGSMRHSNNGRWVYDAEADSPIPQVPEFVMLGGAELRKAISLSEHEHPGCFEFVMIERGKAAWELDGVIYETQAGDLFHTRPGEKHRGGFNVIEPCKFWWIIIAAPHHEGWLRMLPEESGIIEQALAQLPRVFPIGLQAAENFKKLQLALMHNHVTRSIAVRHALQELMIACAEPGRHSRSVADDLAKKFDSLIARAGQEPEWRPSVEELAALSGVSSSHFYRMFQEYTGEPPITFIERLRIKEACRQLLQEQQPVTDLAFRLGYQSSQHFATVFKRFVGVTPTAWRNERR